MIDILFEVGVSNAVVSLAIAMVALAVGKFARMPHLAYLLWLLVLVKLLMPSLLALPFLPGAEAVLHNQPETLAIVETSLAKAGSTGPSESQIAGNGSMVFYDIFPAIKRFGQTYIPVIWGLGIIIALAWSLVRVFRFNRLLKISSDIAPRSIHKMCGEIASKLNLSKLPLIKTTSAEISPMVWWVGGKVQIIIPAALVEKLEPEKLRLVLAHELAHVRRRDHLVRWIEWSAGVLFWWNPVVRWAQRNLRANEEICCDALILSSLKPQPHQYAASLLSAVENFAGSALRPPSMASEVNSGGFLIRRIHMILSNENNRTLSGRLQILVLFVAVLILPLGLINAQEKKADQELKEIQTRLKADVEAGKISVKEAKAKMAAEKRKFELRRAEEKLNAAVKAGEISAKVAEKTLRALKARGNAKVQSEVDLKGAAEDIIKALKARKISKAEAETRMSNIKRIYATAKRKAELALAANKLEDAVKANNISQAEAEAKMSELKKRYAYAEHADGIKMATGKLELAQKLGKISSAEAEARMMDLKQRYMNSRRAAEVNMAAEKLERARRSGKLTKEEAEARMHELKLKYKQQKQYAEFKLAAEKLSQAVKAGKISNDEAKARLAEIEKQMKKAKPNN